MSRIVRTPQAEVDLIEIWRYIALDQQSPEAADALLRGFDETIHTLALQPLIGQSLERIRPGLRMFPRGSYIIFYQPLADGLLVYRVLHGARDWQQLLQSYSPPIPGPR